MKNKLQNMTTENFIHWMNSEFLDPHKHGRFNKIHTMEDNSYWSYYLCSLGFNLALAISNGVKKGCFNTSEQYVQYIEDDNFFLSFDTKEQFFSEVYSLESILQEIEYERN